MRSKKPKRELEPELRNKGENVLEKVQELARNRMFLIVAGAMLSIALVGGVSSVLILRANSPTADGESATGIGITDPDIPETAEVLPQQVRTSDVDHEDDTWAAFQPYMDPFSDPMKLTGVVFGGRGGAMAIIESSGTSFIVSEGDYVDDFWAVRSIFPDSVILRAHSQEVSLYFDQPPETRTIEPLWDEDDEEEEEDDSEEGS